MKKRKLRALIEICVGRSIASNGLNCDITRHTFIPHFDIFQNQFKVKCTRHRDACLTNLRCHSEENKYINVILDLVWVVASVNLT